jgi:hypothetical protein
MKAGLNKAKMLKNDILACPEAEFFDVVGRNVLEEFSSLLFTVTSTTDFTPLPHPPPEQKWVETGL